MNQIANLSSSQLSDLQRVLEEALDCSLQRHGPSEYALAESLRVYLDKNGKCATEHRAEVVLRVYFSHRTTVYAVFPLDVKQRFVPYGHLLPTGRLSQEAFSVVEKVRKSIESFGLTEMDESQFHQAVNGEVTELDGSPATKFQFYFAELI